MSSKGKNKYIGSSFDSWLEEEGIQEDVDRAVAKQLLASKIEKAKKRKGWSKAKLAERMATSKTAVERMLDPEYQGVTLKTLFKAAHVLDKTLHIDLR